MFDYEGGLGTWVFGLGYLNFELCTLKFVLELQPALVARR